jgi:uncharacterized membrane protein
MIEHPPAADQSLLEERILRRIPLEILAISLVLALGAGLLFSLLTALFVLAGGAFSALSFLWLKRALGRFLTREKRRALRSAVAFYILRLFLLIAVFSAIILLFPRMILAFVAGFSSVVPAFLIEAVGALSQMRKWKS